MDGQPVAESKARVAGAEIGNGCVPLQFRGERGERVREVLQELKHFCSRNQVLHHREAHQVQAEVPGDRGCFHGCPKPAHMGCAADLRWLVHPAVPGRACAARLKEV